MTESENLSREVLYRNWYTWVTTNLGFDDKLTSIATNAAVDTAVRGGGFNAAVQAAQAAWVEARSANTSLSKKGHARRNIRIGCAVLIVIGIIAVVLVIMNSGGGGGQFCVNPNGNVC